MDENACVCESGVDVRSMVAHDQIWVRYLINYVEHPSIHPSEPSIRAIPSTYRNLLPLLLRVVVRPVRALEAGCPLGARGPVCGHGHHLPHAIPHTCVAGARTMRMRIVLLGVRRGRRRGLPTPGAVCGIVHWGRGGCGWSLEDEMMEWGKGPPKPIGDDD
jgi:hypothetical protein